MEMDIVVKLTKIITLIDGERLVDLVAKYELYVTPVVTYELGEFFTELI